MMLAAMMQAGKKGKRKNAKGHHKGKRKGRHGRKR